MRCALHAGHGVAELPNPSLDMRPSAAGHLGRVSSSVRRRMQER